MGLLDAPALTPQAAARTYSRPRPLTLAIFGDSFTEMCDGIKGLFTYRGGRGFVTWAMHRLGQRLVRVSRAGTLNGGVTGNTTAQILARVQADVLALNPGYAHVLAGTNDAISGVAFATTQANLIAIYDAIQSAGIRLIVGTIAPYSSATTAQLVAIERINKFIREQARTRPGVLLVDYHAVLANADGNFRITGTLAYTADGTHPSCGGAMRMGKALADVLAPVVPASLDLPSSNVDSVTNQASFAVPNILTNPMMIGTTGTAGTELTGPIATSWVIGKFTTSDLTGVVASKVARTDVPGEWQQFVLTNTSQKLRYQQTLTLGGALAVGDIVYMEAEYELESLTALSVFRSQLAAFDQNNNYANKGTVSDPDINASDVSTLPLDYMPLKGVLKTPPLTIVTSTTGLTCAVDLSFVGTGRIGRTAIRRIRP